MLRKICMVLALAVVCSFTILTVIGCQKANTSAPEASVAQQMEEPSFPNELVTKPVVTASGVDREALLPNKIETSRGPANYSQVEVVYIGDSELVLGSLLQYPGIVKFTGVGHEHFARADI